MPVLPIIAVAAVAAAGVAAYSAVEQGQAQSNAANYQAQVARNNATIAKQNADYAMQAGSAKATTTSLEGAALGGRIKASQGANSIDVNSGSAVSVQKSQRQASNVNTQNVLQDAALRAYGYRTQADNFTGQAGLDVAEGQQAETGSYLKAGGSLLGSASALGGFSWGGGGGDTPGTFTDPGGGVTTGTNFGGDGGLYVPNL